jgi:hypothetical protein
MAIHKAEPKKGDKPGVLSECRHCGVDVRHLAADQGWVHADGYKVGFGPEQNWWDDHDNLVTLCNWLAENGRSGGEVAYAVEKPWKYEDEFNEATKEEAS